jgi:hypothetical protein
MHGLGLFRPLALVAGAFVLLVQAASAQGVQPSAVVDTYERAWGKHDVDGALGVLDDYAVITLQDTFPRSLTSRQQIREFLQSTGLESTPVLTSDRNVDGSTLTWSEHTDGMVMGTSDLTVEAVVQNGKIQSLIYRHGTLVKGNGRPTTGLTTESAGMALAAIVLFGLGLMSLATMRPHVRSGSNLRGRLVRDLRHWRTRAASSRTAR